MIPVLKKRVGRAGGFLGSEPVATITTTKVGTPFQIYFRGTSGKNLYILPGDGGSSEVLTLQGPSTSVLWQHTYSSGPNTIYISGDTQDVVFIYSASMNVTNNIKNILVPFTNKMTFIRLSGSSISGIISSVSRFVNVTNLELNVNNLIGDLNSLCSLTKLSRCFVGGNLFTFSTGTFSALTGGPFNFDSCLSVAGHVDNLLIALAAGGMHDCTLGLAGTNPARTSASDAAVATLTANNVILNLTP